MGRLDDKVAIITGGNSGLGAFTAKKFAAEGATVVVTARREAPLKEVVDEITAAGGRAMYVVCDVSKSEDADRVVAETVTAYGKVDVLVNNAGVLEEGLKPIDRCTNEDIDWVLDINTKGAMYCARAASKEMDKAGSGSIINVDSIAGYYGCGGAAYVASKAAVIGLTKHTALRFAGKGIRSNSVCPGTIVTPMVAQMRPDNLDPDMLGQMAKHADHKIPPCMPEDVANVILFLASDESRCITGQELLCDFGSAL